MAKEDARRSNVADTAQKRDFGKCIGQGRQQVSENQKPNLCAVCDASGVLGARMVAGDIMENLGRSRSSCRLGGITQKTNERR